MLHAIFASFLTDTLLPQPALLAVLGEIRLTRISGRALAQTVSHWIPNAATRIRALVRSCGICCGQSGTGVGFLRVHCFPLPIHIPRIAPQIIIYHLGLVK
jgi:hypothetical protein